MSTRRQTLATLLGAGLAATWTDELFATGRPEARPVKPAKLARPEPSAGEGFVPLGEYQTRASDFDYVEEEWFASGTDDKGRPYNTHVFVRRPRDPSRFSGTVLVEPLHTQRIAPIYMYSSPYILRSGHGWVCVTSQKLPLDEHIKASNTARYARLHIETDPALAGKVKNFGQLPLKLGSNGLQGVALGDPRERARYFAKIADYNQASNAILAQTGAALRGAGGPFAGYKVGHVILMGHSQTGFVSTNFIRSAHETHRLSNGQAAFDGYMPTGMPGLPFGPRDVPLLQLLSEGDMADAQELIFPEGYGRRYRRPDSDAPDDRYRLYELAGMPHMGTRYAPHRNPAMWQAVLTAGAIPPSGVTMNSLPHHEMFNMALDHLVRWVSDGTAPPHAPRLKLTGDGRYFAKDEHGNTKGGVRCVQMDVPRATYHANPQNADGTPAFGTVALEEPFDKAKMARLYGTPAEYVARFDRRLDELVSQRWFLADHTAPMRAEARAQNW